MKVRAWMSHPVIAASEADPARKAYSVMNAVHIRHMPVVDAEGTLVGIISDRDLEAPCWEAKRLMTPGEAPHIPDGLTVGEIMSDVVIAVGPDDHIGIVAQTLIDARVHAVPVVDEKSVLLGIVTTTDALRAMMIHLPRRLRSP